MNKEMTVWQFLEKRLNEQDGTALKYCGNGITRNDMIGQVDRWARMFKGMGVSADDKVAVFTPFIPEAVYAILALNSIGAWPVLLNIWAGDRHLASGVKGARYAVVARAYEPMAEIVFRHNRALKNVVLLDETSGMPLFAALRNKVKFMGLDKALSKLSRNYISSKKAMKLWGGFKGETVAEYDAERPAFVISSCGENPNLIKISNSAAIAAIMQAQKMADRYANGGVCLNTLSPFSADGLMTLFLMPLYCGMTCSIGTVTGMSDSSKILSETRPQVCGFPGRVWVRFFTHVQRMAECGKAPDLSHFTLPMMFGDSVTKKDLKWMNDLLEKCGCKVGICTCYSVSEMFSIVSADLGEGFATDDDRSPAISAGEPLTEVAVMDSYGNMLGCGERGEICIKGPSIMSGYYRNDELTEASIRNGWFISGDLGEIDSNGHIHIYGKFAECRMTQAGTLLHPFDIENIISADSEVKCCMIVNMAMKGQTPRYAAHIVLKHGCKDSNAAMWRIDEAVIKSCPSELQVEGYCIHRHVFATTPMLRIDRDYYAKRRTGYFKPDGDRITDVTF